MVGTTLNHYRVIRQIGAGGMGEVYEAEDTRLHRKVALKVLPKTVACVVLSRWLRFLIPAPAEIERNQRAAMVIW